MLVKKVLKDQYNLEVFFHNILLKVKLNHLLYKYRKVYWKKMKEQEDQPLHHQVDNMEMEKLKNNYIY